MADKPAVAPNSRSLARQKALQALYQWELNDYESARIESDFEAEQDMGGTDRAWFRKLFRGVSGQADTLDARMTEFLDRPVAELDPIERNILRIGSYELIHCPRVPWRVVINESVDLARAFGADASHKYINGVLDKLATQLRETAASSDAVRK